MICQNRAFFSESDFYIDDPATIECKPLPTQWNPPDSPFTGAKDALVERKCIYLSSKEVTWYDANEACKSAENSSALVIWSWEENQEIQSEFVIFIA